MQFIKIDLCSLIASVYDQAKAFPKAIENCLAINFGSRSCANTAKPAGVHWAGERARMACITAFAFPLVATWSE
ncbi:hypothetical protein [Pseudomonas segetis]|uniref:hypothetical protein n=1 Tax=Pseudomonas segetis TaxID=298908 RepID=UPI000B7895C0|nr:hypothetical protein [Pseudomonas segetis]